MGAMTAVQRTDPATVEVARNLGANETQILRTVVIPASMPGILSGLRSSLQLSFLVTPVAEMIVGAIGLGGLIWRSADLFMVDLMVAGQITLGVLGLILMFIFRHVEVHYLTPWLPHRDSE
jgi:ABC-type nitrate/sulfonate/bicarbonate transport system permease component